MQLFFLEKEARRRTRKFNNFFADELPQQDLEYSQTQELSFVQYFQIDKSYIINV